MRPHVCSHQAAGLMLAMVATGFSTGCSTAPVALEQANHTVKLMSLLDGQLTEFRRVQSTAEQARLESMRIQKDKLLVVEESATLDIQAAKSAGDTVREPFAKNLLADADGLGDLKARSRAQQASLQTRLGELLVPLPSTAASIAQAQTKAALLGRELDSKTRFEEIQTFVRELAENIKANRKKIHDAQAAASKADEQAAAADKAAAQNKP